ncbi:uncharacterized protein MELLADRAFT_112328 [Melampsora larici-populina 98AG31]|uniref:Uncharacterized protein n=1 Tax=Melampsora larici-populina (strain 98AG31 / pathotype 3-4-7) TaxID=747676 RepID=F4S649_MELLP|nr:uncharacterized protein MELLADRAFT_112328 [Melampsora larici-populina 98AG31]EGF99872.1 hypothetical protein MELLADRAFT_112328 [Melampsora larici-populina 98AG31]
MPRLWLNTFTRNRTAPASSGQDDLLHSSPLSTHEESASKQKQPLTEAGKDDHELRDGSSSASTQYSMKRLTPRSHALESLASSLPQKSPVPYLSKRLPSPPTREEHSDNHADPSNLTRRMVHSVRIDHSISGSRGATSTSTSALDFRATEDRVVPSICLTSSPKQSMLMEIKSSEIVRKAEQDPIPAGQSLRRKPDQELDHVAASLIESPQKPDASGGIFLVASHGTTTPSTTTRSGTHTIPSISLSKSTQAIDGHQCTDGGPVISGKAAEKSPEKRSKHKSRTNEEVRAKEKRERHKSSHPRLEANDISGEPEQSSSGLKSRVRKSSSHSHRRASSCTQGIPTITDKDGKSLDSKEEKPSGSSSRRSGEKKRHSSKSSEQKHLVNSDEGMNRNEKVRAKSTRSRSKSDASKEKASRELHRSQRASMAAPSQASHSTPREQLSKLDLLKTRASISSYSPLAAFLGTTSSSAANTPATCSPLQRLPYSFENALKGSKIEEENTSKTESPEFRSLFASMPPQVPKTSTQLDCISPTNTQYDSSFSSAKIPNVVTQLEDAGLPQKSTSPAQEVSHLSDSEANNSGRDQPESIGQQCEEFIALKNGQEISRQIVSEQKALECLAKEELKSMSDAPLRRASIMPISVKTSSSVLSENEDPLRKYSTVSSVSTQCSSLFSKQTSGSPTTPPSSHYAEITSKSFGEFAMSNISSTELTTEDPSIDDIESKDRSEAGELEHRGVPLESLTKDSNVNSTGSDSKETKSKKEDKLTSEIDQILAEIGQIFPEPPQEDGPDESLKNERDRGVDVIKSIGPDLKTKADEIEKTATSPLKLSKRHRSRTDLSNLDPIYEGVIDSPASMQSPTTLYPVLESTSESCMEANLREHMKTFEMTDPRGKASERQFSNFYMDLGHYTDHVIMTTSDEKKDDDVHFGGQDVREYNPQRSKLTIQTGKSLQRTSDLSCVTPAMRIRLSNSLKEKNATLVEVEEAQNSSSCVVEGFPESGSNNTVGIAEEDVLFHASPDQANMDDHFESETTPHDDSSIKISDKVPQDISQSNLDESGTSADSAKIDATHEQKQMLEAMTGQRRKPKISRRATEPGMRPKDQASDIGSPSVTEKVPSEAAAEKDTVKVPKPRFEHALLRHPRILQTLISRMDYLDFYTLPQISRKLRYGLNSGEPREVILERYLGAVGYRKEPSEEYMYSTQGYQTKGPSGVRTNYRQTLGSTPSNSSNPLRRLRSASVISLSSRLKELQISLKDLHAYYTGLEFGPEELAELADRLRSSGLDLPTFRMIRASTRSYNKLLVRIRSQSALLEEESQAPRSTSYHLGKPLLPIYALGKPAVFKVWVPTADLWMSREELVECERELWKSEVRPLMRRGDVCHNTAVGARVNEGRVLFDGRCLQDLDITWDHLGHLPPWLNMFMFPPSYYHHVISSSTTTPVFFLDLTEFKDQIQRTMELCKDKVRVPTNQVQVMRRNSCYRVQRWVYRSVVRVTPGTRTSVVEGLREWDSPDMGSGLIHRDWVGKLVIEVEGTTEKARDLVQRCTKASVDSLISADKISSYRFASKEQQQAMRVKLRSAQLSPWKIIRERSRPGLLWLQAAYYANEEDLIE